MNSQENKMVELLNQLKSDFNVVGVKMEFEAEGTRLEEAMRLKEISLRAGCHLTLKIGGCEAIRDMYEAANLGTDNLVAPMVETPYALKKYLSAIKIGFPDDVRRGMKFFINIETDTAVKNFTSMMAMPETKDLDGIVIGRVDLCGSLNLTRDDINSEKIESVTCKIAIDAKKNDKLVVVGGGVSFASLDFLNNIPKGYIDRYETRKIVFKCPEALTNSKKAFLLAVEFELMWLKNKQNYYKQISKEDESRLNMMEARYKNQINSIMN